MSVPVPRICWPFVIDDTNDEFIVGLDDGGGEDLYVGAVAHGTYATPEALADALDPPAFTPALPMGVSGTIALTEDLMFTFMLTGLTPGTVTRLGFSESDEAAALGDLLGFDTSADPTTVAGTTANFNADWQMQHCWTYDKITAARSDTKECAVIARTVVESTDGTVQINLAELLRRTVELFYLPIYKTFQAEEGDDHVNESIQRLWREASRFRYYPDRADLNTYGTYALDEECAQNFEPERMYETLEIYRVTLKMIGTS
jgi:hypothetical protein